jgi:hypothetical protein
MGNYVFNPNTGKTELAADQNRPITTDPFTGQQGQSTITPGEPGGNIGGQVQDGPLDSLSQNPYATQNLSYPRDLGSSQKLHSVQFRAYEVDSSNFTVSDVIDVAKTKYNDVATATTSVSNKSIEELKTDTLNLAKKVGNGFVDTFNGNGSNLRAKAQTNYKKDVKDTITLYMPDNAEFSYGASYHQIGLLEAAASVPVLGAVPNAILSTLSNAAVRVALNSMGYVFNPQEQVLFEGISFRTFNMSFTLTPFSAVEANEIKNIIKAFRKNAAPTIASGGAGFFFIPPSVFDITFRYGESENPNINRLKRCVLTDVNVNYAPNGTWSTHADGSPVQTSLTLSFKEIELVDRTAVEDGY